LPALIIYVNDKRLRGYQKHILYSNPIPKNTYWLYYCDDRIG
jgi:hypothetical protein